MRGESARVFVPTLTGWSTSGGYLRPCGQRTLAQPHGDRLALAVAHHVELRLLARAQRLQRGAEVGRVVHLVARHRDDHVAALLVGLRLEADLAPAAAADPRVGPRP